jgi:hypothetical protein
VGRAKRGHANPRVDLPLSAADGFGGGPIGTWDTMAGFPRA